MDVGSGALAVRSALTVGAGGSADLTVSGGVTVGAGTDGALITRHVDGKMAGSDGPDDLHLNWGTGKTVHVGGGALAPLAVHGSAVVEANLRAGGGLTLPHGGTIESEGRLHVTGGELLFLLNHDGVVVSKAWDGNGNLTVEGTLRTSTSVTLPPNSTIAGDGRLHITGGELLFLLNHDGVVVGKEWGGNGNLTVEGALRASGGVTLPGNGTINSEGRLHIAGEEILFLLNKQGVVVGRGWGGNGNLTVEGLLRANDGLTLPANLTIHGEGRLHIGGEEILFLLNKQGVVVSKAWGGNGNLTVEGPQLLCNGRPPPASWSGGGVSTWDLFAGGGVFVGTDPENPQIKMWNDGTVSAKTKRFVIDHPLDPENRTLAHACVEGPEAAVYYRGSGRLVEGRAEVELPEYFEALARTEDRTVMLTAVCDEGEPVAVLAASPVRGGRFTVRAADGSNPRQRFHWEVKAVRADVDRLVVEPTKQGRELVGAGRAAATEA